MLQACTDDDVSDAGFPFGTCRSVELGDLQVLASRISYVGELGWELYVPMEEGARAWDRLWRVGQQHGVVPVGIGVYATTGRLEKAYRAFGNELTRRVRHRGGRHGTSVGEKGRLHRQAGLPRAAEHEIRSRSCAP